MVIVLFILHEELRSIITPDTGEASNILPLVVYQPSVFHAFPDDFQKQSLLEIERFRNIARDRKEFSVGISRAFLQEIAMLGPNAMKHGGIIMATAVVTRVGNSAVSVFSRQQKIPEAFCCLNSPQEVSCPWRQWQYGEVGFRWSHPCGTHRDGCCP